MLFVMWVSENTCCLTSRLWKKAKVTIDSEYTHQFLFSFFFFSCCAWKWKIRWYNPAPETWQGVCFAVLTGVVLLIKTGFCWWLMSLEHVLETCGVIIFFFSFFLEILFTNQYPPPTVTDMMRSTILWNCLPPLPFLGSWSCCCQ